MDVRGLEEFPPEWVLHEGVPFPSLMCECSSLALAEAHTGQCLYRNELEVGKYSNWEQ